ncbi:hypothetical protein F5Y17DRAFT_424542 [Xylariaceae sp. FL0594]|nr:hypothetical protein F5Y17DRAFT_424542 [Xylariaceae sp. FL0594]
MEDQFGGRTDDDLFADDFEPVAEPIPEPEPVPSPEPTPDEAQPATTVPDKSVQSTAISNPPKKTLAHSRHATPAHQPRPRKRSPKKSGGTPRNLPPGSADDAATGEESSTGAGASASGTAPARPGSNTALADRLASGANPRTKLSESELAEKMERMRILSAEKARKFEQAEKDSRSHAIAYEKGMEEARRRRAEEAERRRKGEEERRQMDQERAANRERKLKALGAKEGGWDEGKTAEDERERRAFRGAYGGIRGARNHRNGEGDTEEYVREFSVDEFRGRARGGRGRGGSRGGRGGRGGLSFSERNAGDAPPHRHQSEHHQQQQKPKPEQKPPSADDFPALPPPTETSAAVKLPPSLSTPLVGKWDDEMAALDAKTS